MKQISWFLGAFYIAGFCFFCYSAEAQFPSQPKSRSNGVAQNTATPLPTPAPQKIEVAPPIVNVSPPNVSVSPQLVSPAPSFMDEVKTWLMTIFTGLIAAAFGKFALFGVKTAGPSADGTVPAVVSVLERMKARVTNPDTRANIDSLILQAVQSGIPGMAVQTGLSMVPGVGPIASRLEPIIRQKVIEALQERTGAAPSAAPDLTSALGGLRDLIESRLPPRP